MINWSCENIPVSFKYKLNGWGLVSSLKAFHENRVFVLCNDSTLGMIIFYLNQQKEKYLLAMVM